MCCEDEEQLGLPAAVIEMIARYRRMRAEQGFGWGERELPEFFGWARFSRLGPAFAEYAATGDWAGAVRAAVGTGSAAGLAVVTVAAGGELTARTGPPRPVIDGGTVPLDVVVLAETDHDVTVTVADQDIRVPARGAGYAVLDATATTSLVASCGGRRVDLAGAIEAAAAGALRLASSDGARWSVVDATGGAWFPAGVPAKWDAADRPFFHTDPGEHTMAVPAGRLTVTVGRGMEFVSRESVVDVAEGGTARVEHRPERRFDPIGWRGADLHVHLNYSGDHVLHPADAARMQRGEGLDLMQLAAGNLGGDLVYDRELLEATVGSDLWAGDGGVARAGLEFRNALLGHVHGFGLTGVPEVLHTGDEGTDHPWDWPPNRVACRRMRDLGGVPTYAHPVHAPDEDSLFRPFRMVEARELIADAATGAVEAMELASCFDDAGAMTLYHHLLSCGLRLAAVAGTDCFLSFARGPVPTSNPPGWCRVYAQVGADRGVDAFTAAMRAGRTLVTNGPWLTLDVAGAGPGAVLERAAGEVLAVRATATGAERLVLHGPDGEIATSTAGPLVHDVAVEAGTWLAVSAHGPLDPHTGSPVFAHTSPVYVDVGGARVARADSARWCLDQLDTLEALAREQGRFEHDGQLADLVAVLDEARAFYRSVERRAR